MLIVQRLATVLIRKIGVSDACRIQFDSIFSLTISSCILCSCTVLVLKSGMFSVNSPPSMTGSVKVIANFSNLNIAANYSNAYFVVA
jgi:hypothetical protein